MSQLAKLLTVLLVFSLILGQFARIPLFADRLYAFDLLAGVYALFSILVILSNIKRINYTFTFFEFFSFTIWAGLSLLRSKFIYGYPDFAFQLFYLVRWTLYLISALGVVVMIQRSMFSYYWFLKLLMLCGLVISIAGFIQLFLLPDFTVLDPVYGWDPHKNRLTSTFFDPNFVGAFLVCTLSIYLGLIYVGKLDFWKNYVYTLLFFIIPVSALFITFSRSAWGMFAVVVLIFGLLKYRVLLAVFLAMCFLVYFAVPRVQTRLSGITDPADSAHFRLESWGNAVLVAKSDPVFGVGFNSYRYAQKELGFFSAGETGGNSGAGADSSMLFILATTGIVGLVLFFSGYVVAIIYAYRNRKLGGVIGFSILVALFFESVFINSIFYPQLLFIWLIFALINFKSNRFDILQ